MFRKLKILLRLSTDIWLMIISYFPGPVGYSLRYRYWKRKLKYLGNHVRIDIGVYFQNPDFISISDNSWIDRNVIVLAGGPHSSRVIFEKNNSDFTLKIGEVFIGECTHVAPNCVLSGIGGLYIGKNSGIASNSAIYSFSHHYRNLKDNEDKFQYSFSPQARLDQQAMILGPIFIGDYCAIGLNSVVLPGASIKKGSWVASGTVVSGSFSDQTLIYSRRNLQNKSLSRFKIKE